MQQDSPRQTSTSATRYKEEALLPFGSVGSTLDSLESVDLWASVTFDHLPRDLVASVENESWPQVRDQLATVMDAVTTDGVYGRELLQLVMRLPLGIYPVFDCGIAERLNLRAHTVARHMANARAKLGAASRAEAAAKFRQSEDLGR